MLIAGKKILVTGGAGFLGSHLCEKMLEEGAEVAVLDSFDSGRLSNITSFQDRVRLFQGDMSDKKLLFYAGAGRQVVIHTAIPLAVRQQKCSFEQLAAAISGFLNVLELCLAEDALLVEISSIAVYGNPKYRPVDEGHPLEPEIMYGAIKLAEEYYCRTLFKTHGLKTVILRVADIYGPKNTRLSVPINFLLKGMRNNPITVFGDGTQGRSYTYVSDFVDAVVLAVANEKVQGEIFNISSGQYVSMWDLAQAVRTVTGGGTLVLNSMVNADKRVLDIDITKAKAILGFDPKVDLITGLKTTFDWIKENPGYWG